MQRIIPMTLVLCFSSLLGCSVSLGGDGDSNGDESSSADDDVGEGGGDGFEPCSASSPCPDGQFCFNGLCAIGCLSDDDCAESQYCATEGDMLCHASEVPTCDDDSDCANSQVCINGFCAAAPEPSDAGCSLEDYLDDGCPSNSVCLVDPDQEDTGVCYQMPACSADGTCPVGIEGAVCNDGYLPSKDSICLIGLCENTSHCPSDWACVHFNQSVVGGCSAGSFGSPCNSGADCISGMCTEIPGLGGGICA